MEKLLLTDKILDKLGFTPYNDENGDSGTRILYVGDNILKVWDMDEIDDETQGYGSPAKYRAKHFMIPDYGPVYFLHELLDVINKEDIMLEFVRKCHLYNMGFYLDEYKANMQMLIENALFEINKTKTT